MRTSEMVWFAGLIFLLFSLFTLWLLRREYRTLKRLSWLGSTVHVLVFVFHGVFCGMLAWGPESIPPMGPGGMAGVILMVLGVAITAYSMDLLNSFSRWLGSGTHGLSTDRLYTYTRNPQFLGYGLFLVGFAVAWWNPINLIGLAGYAALVYFLALIEEEHLEEVYGQPYREYAARTPRFLGVPKKQ